MSAVWKAPVPWQSARLKKDTPTSRYQLVGMFGRAVEGAAQHDFGQDEHDHADHADGRQPEADPFDEGERSRYSRRRHQRPSASRTFLSASWVSAPLGLAHSSQ